MRKFDKVLRPERFQLTLPSDFKGTVRADQLLKIHFPYLSRRIGQDLFIQKAVRINGRPVARGYRPSAGDTFEILLPAPPGPFPLSDPSLSLPVIFKDDDLLIIEKPGGIPTHPLSPFEKGTVANSLMALFPEMGGVGEKPLEPGLVHRLDRGTSGLLALARNEKSWIQMKEDLIRRRWKKTYWALVEGVLKEALTISLPLAHDPGDDQKMKVIRSEKDKKRGRVYQALTRVRPQKVFGDHTLVAIDLITGVMHQIRVHLSAIGLPIMWDTLYGAQTLAPPLLPPKRFFLHAGRLSLPHPITREPKTFSLPFPEDLRRVLDRLRLS